LGLCVQSTFGLGDGLGDSAILLQSTEIWEFEVRNCSKNQPAGSRRKRAILRRGQYGIENYSRGRRNSSPNSRTSPKMSCRLTRAMIGGVSLGTRLEEAGEGAGIVKCTVCSGRKICEEVMQAPVALILRVFVSSMNSNPVASDALRKTGTCRRKRGERRVCEESTRESSLTWSRRMSIIVPEH